MNNLRQLPHRIHQIKEYYQKGGISEVISRGLMLGTRQICTGIICKSKPENISTAGNSILYIDSASSRNRMWIEDSIERLPTLQAIAERYQTRIDVLCQPNKYFLFKGQEGFWEVFTNPSGLSLHFEQIAMLKAQKYTGAILVKPDWNYIGLLPLLCNLPKIVLSQLWNPYINRTEELYNSARTQGFIDNSKWEIPSPKIQPLVGLISKIPRTPWKKRVVLYTEAENALRSYKNWRGIISDIKRVHNNADIIILGKTKRIMIPKNIPLHDLRGETPSLRDVMAELQSADIFIGADGGMAHLSMALGIPSIVISTVSPVKEIIQEKQQPHVIPIVAACPNKDPCGVSLKSRWFRCEVTGQSAFDHTQSPPCIRDDDMNIRKQVFEEMWRILGQSH